MKDRAEGHKHVYHKNGFAVCRRHTSVVVVTRRKCEAADPQHRSPDPLYRGKHGLRD